MLTLTEAISEFLIHCQYEKNLSEKTIKAYTIDLTQFKNYLKIKGYSQLILDITKQEIKEFLISISDLKPKSVKRKIATIKAMFNYLEFEDIIKINPFRKMRIKIRVPQNLPKAMSKKEVLDILKIAYSEFFTEKNSESYSYTEKLKNIVVVELLFATGARVSEIANLKKSQINLKTGTILIKGKGNKERIINVCNRETLSILQNYYKHFSDQIKQSDNNFLINRLGKKLSDQSIRTIVRKLASSTSIAQKVTPHMFRHTFATLLLEKDVDIKYIQSMLGHSSILTTQIYTQVNSAKQKQILRMKHPRKDLVMM